MNQIGGKSFSGGGDIHVAFSFLSVEVSIFFLDDVFSPVGSSQLSHEPSLLGLLCFGLAPCDLLEIYYIMDVH